MNKLSKIVGTVCISLMGSIGSANADSSAFTGAYVAVTGSAIGMALDGTKTRTILERNLLKVKLVWFLLQQVLKQGFRILFLIWHS